MGFLVCVGVLWKEKGRRERESWEERRRNELWFEIVVFLAADPNGIANVKSF